MRQARALGVVLAFGLLSCDSPFGPTRAYDAPPPLTGFSLIGLVLRDGGAFALMSAPEDESFRLPRGAHLPVELSTSRGDAERMRLTPMLCGSNHCHLAELIMHEGESLLDFDRTIRAAGARLGSVRYFSFLSGDYGTVWVLDGKAGQFVDRILRYPSVDIAQQSGWISHQPSSVAAHVLAGGVPVSTEPVRPRNGTLSLAIGDTVFAHYVSAAGDTLAWQWAHTHGFNTP